MYVSISLAHYCFSLFFGGAPVCARGRDGCFGDGGFLHDDRFFFSCARWGRVGDYDDEFARPYFVVAILSFVVAVGRVLLPGFFAGLRFRAEEVARSIRSNFPLLPGDISPSRILRRKSYSLLSAFARVLYGRAPCESFILIFLSASRDSDGFFHRLLRGFLCSSVFFERIFL